MCKRKLKTHKIGIGAETGEPSYCLIIRERNWLEVLRLERALIFALVMGDVPGAP